MAHNFDPYHKWLGIPPRDQPPNHYRLLGIEMLEDDGDVIEAAANRLMAYLQDLSTGEQMEHAQRVLNEVNNARLCLLAHDKRAEYDAQLKAKQAQSRSTSQTSSRPQPPQAMAVPRAVPIARATVAPPRPKVVAHPCPSCASARAAADASCGRCGYDPQLSAITQLDKEQPRLSERSGITKRPKGLDEPPQKTNVVLIASLVGVGMLLTLGGVAAFVLSSSKESTTPPSPPNVTPQSTVAVEEVTTKYKYRLNIKIAEKDRKGVRLTINDQLHPIPPKGSVSFSVYEGKQIVRLTRNGFEPFETTIDVAAMRSNIVTPTWKPTAKRNAPARTTPKNNATPAKTRPKKKVALAKPPASAPIRPVTKSQTGRKGDDIWTLAIVEASVSSGNVDKRTRSSFVVKNPKPGEVYTITVTTDINPITAIRIEALKATLPKGPGTGRNGEAKLHHVTLKQGGQLLALREPWSNSEHDRRTWKESTTLEADGAGWLVADKDTGRDMWIAYLVDYGKVKPSDKPLELVLSFQGPEPPFGHVRISVTGAKKPNPED